MKEPGKQKINPPKEGMTRFTIDISNEMHRRMKVYCAIQGNTMRVVINKLLERLLDGKDI